MEDPEDYFKKTPEQMLAEASRSGIDACRAQEAAAHANMLRLRAERLAREATKPLEGSAR
jgi:hypothetical protein